MTFIAWPEIEGFHHVRKHVRVYPDLLKGRQTVSYRCKVKLHGTNAAVQVHLDGTVLAQSRSNLITPENDNAGFARWIDNNAAQFRGVLPFAKMAGLPATGYIIYGEWCGPSIQKGVALSQIPKKVFAVFAARPLEESNKLLVEPEELSALVNGIPDVYVLPWHDVLRQYGSDTRVCASVEVDWSKTDEEVAATIAPINDWVLAIEENDPWVERNFGVKGTGEGLVFYPGYFSEEAFPSWKSLSYEDFNNLCFKAKGEKHKNIKTRLDQGATIVGGKDLKLTGKFVAWCLADIQKECQDEMEASNLTWKDLQKPLSDKARAWYLTEAKK